MDQCAVFGGMFRSGPQMIDISAGTLGTTLAMDAPLPLANVNFTGNSTLSIQCSGTYELTFFGNFSFSANSHLTFYVKANGTTLTETVVEKDVAAGVQDSFERSVIVHLCANTSLIAAVDNASTTNGGANGRLTIPANGVHLEVIRIGA